MFELAIVAIIAVAFWSSINKAANVVDRMVTTVDEVTKPACAKIVYETQEAADLGAIPDNILKMFDLPANTQATTTTTN